MNIGEIVFIIGFIEAIILFIYATRWYLFSFVSLRTGKPSSTRSEDYDMKSSFVSVLLPVYNEVNVVDRLLKACTNFSSPPYEVIVVDDSNDCVTNEKLKRWQTHPRVKVLHREARIGWKGGALDFGLDNLHPDSTHVLILDADFVPSSDLLDSFLERFIDQEIVAVQGYQKHDLNAEENWITKGTQVWHSIYNMVELNGLRKLGGYSPLTGSVYMIKTDVLKKLRFQGVLCEDTDLTARLYENGYRVLFDPRLTASGECPNTLGRAFKQRMRWAEGHTRVFRNHLLKILMSDFLSLTDKINFLLIGCSLLNCILAFPLMLTWFISSVFRVALLPLPIVTASLLLILASIPSILVSSVAALSIEMSKKDWWKIPYTWIFNILVTPTVAYGALKGLLTKDGYFHRTYKTGNLIGSFSLKTRYLAYEPPKSISVIIPTLNEEIGVARTLADVPSHIPDEIIVVDSSTDETPKIAQKFGAKVIYQPKKGYGRALQTGIQIASSDIIVYIDGDYTYDPKEIPFLINSIVEGNHDVVVGSRIKGKTLPGSMDRLNRFGNILLSTVFKLLTFNKISDTQSGFRAIRKQLLDDLTYEDYGMSFITEQLIKLAKKGARLHEVPVTYKPRIGRTKLRAWTDGFRILKTILKHSFRSCE